MKKPKIEKPKVPEFPPPQLQSDADAIAEIVKIGEVGAKLDARKEALEADVRLKILNAATEIGTLQAELDGRIEAMRIYCAANRDRLTKGGQTKTIKFATGKASWRHCPASVTFGVKVETLIERIKDKGEAFAKFLRETVEIDKEAMLKDSALAKSLGNVRIKSAGEEFYVEPLGTEVSEELETADA